MTLEELNAIVDGVSKPFRRTNWSHSKARFPNSDVRLSASIGCKFSN